MGRDIINFCIDSDQINSLCSHYGMESDELEDYEICELLDKLIDEVCN